MIRNLAEQYARATKVTTVANPAIETEAPPVVTPAPEAAVPKAEKPARAKKAAAAPKAAPAAKKPAAETAAKAPAVRAETNGHAARESKRVRLFRLLASRAPAGMTAAEIREALSTDSIAAMCRDETMAGRLKVVIGEDENARGRTFAISAKGLRAIERGTVDSDAAPKAEWK